jgi:lipoate-protein ligase A
MTVFAELDVYADAVPRSAAMNMAIDEALFETATVPSLRFYQWDHPALSFGYFGRYVDVSSYEPERDLVRRWTGGGIVLHGSDLTYSLVIPARDSAFAHSSMSIYERIHRAIRNVLVSMGQRAEVAAVAAVCDRRGGVIPREVEESPIIPDIARDVSTPLDMTRAVADRRYSNVGHNGHCFANPVRADVLVNGHKVAGAAQRKTRAGLLQQGSIQHVDLAQDFGTHFARELSDTVVARQLNGAILEHAREVAAQKYGADNWLRKR